MVEVLSETWQKLTTDDIYVQWTGGVASGLTMHSGVFNNAPLDKFLTSFINEYGPSFKRKWVVSGVDVETGNYVLWNETTSQPAKAAVTSASIPFVFPLQTWSNGLKVMDGGAVWNTNLVSAVQRCKETVKTESEITLDIIVCDNNSLDKWEDQKNSLGNYLRYNELKGYHDNVADILEFMKAYPDINYRYFVQPSKALPGGLNLLNGDNSTSTFPM